MINKLVEEKLAKAEGRWVTINGTPVFVDENELWTLQIIYDLNY